MGLAIKSLESSGYSDRIAGEETRSCTAIKSLVVVVVVVVLVLMVVVVVAVVVVVEVVVVVVLASVYVFVQNRI